jgi:hypothetical protein
MSFFWWEFTCCNECWDCLLRKYVNNVFCVLFRNVKCDLKNAIQICFLQKLFEWFILVIMFNHFIVNFFWSLNFIFSEWRMLILDYQVTYVCSRFVERRLWWDVRLDETSYQAWRKRLIRLDEWKRHLIKSDESDSSNLMSENVISSNLTKATHQIWRKRHFIKSLKEKTILLFSDEQSHAVTFDVKNLILQKIIFLYENKCLCEIVVISERFNESWTLIKLSFFLREKLQVMSR